MQSADVTATFCAALVDEWSLLGVRLAVVAPGSRSTPMAIALAKETSIRVEVFHDERSAAFAALGAAKQSGVPSLMLCTSGTATANFHPAVVEASHAEVPLIVLTADRPPELQGIGAPQTIDQRDLFGGASRLFVDAGVPDDSRRDDWRVLAQRMYLHATGERQGPVHLNLPFREPLLGTASDLPSRVPPRQRRGSRAIGTNTLARIDALLGGKRGVIVAGAGGTKLPHVALLSARLGWPVIADPLGGSRAAEPNFVRHADAFLRDSAIAERLRPEAILRFGYPPASKVVNTWFRDSRAELVVVSTSPFLVDPDRCCTLHVVCDQESLCDDLQQVLDPCESDWLAEWISAEVSARRIVAESLDHESQLTEPGTARCMVGSLPAGSTLVVSSSMPIRDVEWYAESTNHLNVLSNRGANGIDGVVSTAVGAALASSGSVGLLIGDVAFLHDSNGLLGLTNRSVDLRIVVVDNRGGGIFSFLPQRASLPPDDFERLFGTPHDTDIALIAEAHGLPAIVVRSTQELRDALQIAGPRVILVRTRRDDNVRVHESIHVNVAQSVRETLRLR